MQQHPAHAWRLAIAKAPLKPHEKLAAMMLANYLNDEMRAWPCQATLAEACGINTRNLRHALAGLRAAGWIRTAQNRRAGLTYYAMFGLDDPEQDRSLATGQEDQDRSLATGQEDQDRSLATGQEDQDRSLATGKTGRWRPTELDIELERIPPTPLRQTTAAGGRRRIPTGTSSSTRHRTLADDLTDTSWAT